MSLFAWLRPSAPELDHAKRQRLARLPKPVPLGVCTLREQRWVVLDLETSGLNPNRDQVLSIGAVAI
ncbi:3'-5' exonuclease, partial [Pseudomonas qingdaonensis]